MTPGVDFEEPGSGRGEGRIRIGFPGATEDIREAMGVFAKWWDESETAKQMRSSKRAKKAVE